MTSKRLAVAVAVAVAVLSTACAAQGTSGAQFLGVGVGARAVGMGGAYSAVADDATALHWNPAGLTQIESHTITLSHVAWFSDATYQYASYAFPFGSKGAIGVALEQGSVSWDNTGEGAFETGDFAGVIGYGRRLKPNLGIGGGLKFLSSTLGDDGAASYAFDLGVVYRLGERTRVGATARNIGPGLTFLEETDPLPATLTVGASHVLKDVLLSVDLEKVNDLSARTRVGAEYSPVPSLTLRGGWISGGETALSSLAGGLGVNWKRRWALDYAYRSSELGGTHQFALSAGFGGEPAVAVMSSTGGEALPAEGQPPSGEEELIVVTAAAKSNLTVISELAEEVMEEALSKMGLPEGAHLYLRQVESSDANWLVKSVLLEEVTSRGHTVRSGQMSAAPAGAAEAEEAPEVYEIAYRIVNCQTTLPRSWREWVVGTRKYERRTAVDIRFELSDRTKSIVWAGGVQRERREIIDGSRVDDLAAPGQTFASPTPEAGGWDKIFEPVIVAGIVGGLIYLFYTSRSTE